MPDTTAPTISAVTTSGLTATSVTVSFTTSEAATAWVAYTSTACPCPTVTSAVVGTAHTVPLTGLNPDTIYQYVVSASDSTGNVGSSATLTFRTLVAPVDTQVPTVAFTQPAAGLVVGTVAVTATASDNVGVASVQFRVDGVNLGAADTVAPYGVSWETTTAADGPHTLTAVARDFAGNTATATVLVTVQNTLTPHYLAFDGVDDYLEVADAAELSFGTGTADRPLTVEMWLRADALGRHQLLGKWGETANQEYRLRIVSGYLVLALRDQSAGAEVSADTQANFASLAGGWHHVAATYDGRGGATAANGITIYVDGVAVPVWRNNNPAYVAMEDLAAPLVVGRESQGWNQYGGALDEVRLWNVARTGPQIAAARDGELTGTEPGLVGYWRLNEGTGLTATDNGPGGHTALLLLGPTWQAGGPPVTPLP